MSRDDPIALLRSLDPSDEKEIDAIVLSSGSQRILSTATPRSRSVGLPRRALLLVAAVTLVVALTVLVVDPFSGTHAISSADAKARAASALDLRGAWHIKRVSQTSEVDGAGKIIPSRNGPIVEDIWHSADGRMFVDSKIVGGGFGVCCAVTLFADREQRTYMADRKRVYIRRFALAADMKDAERTFMPPSAADLYRAAYRDGKVRLAAIETLNGRKVYRLVFDWLGSSYTLVFDASRRVPISSESRTPTSTGSVFVTRTRYPIYARVEAGPRLESHFKLPEAASRVKQDFSFPAIVVPRPVEGASATKLARAVAVNGGRSIPTTAKFGRATFIHVQPLPRGSLVAVAVIPNRGGQVNVVPMVQGGRATLGDCVAVVEIAHPGGEAIPRFTGCYGGFVSFWSQDLRTAILVGVTRARRVDIRFADGTTKRAELRRGVYLATLPVAKTNAPFAIVSTARDGTVSAVAARRQPRVSLALPSPR